MINTRIKAREAMIFLMVFAYIIYRLQKSDLSWNNAIKILKYLQIFLINESVLFNKRLKHNMIACLDYDF